MHCAKRAYRSKREAKQAIRSAENQGRKKGDRPMHVYRCPHCGKWHLTRQARRKKRLPPGPKVPR